VITGLWIRTARSVLNWDQKRLARACKLRTETVARAESVEGEPPITVAHLRISRGVLERAGVTFPPGAATDVTLRTRSGAWVKSRDHQPSKLRVQGRARPWSPSPS
jgi:transcriptional regulator with XRE-family HTH domain